MAFMSTIKNHLFKFCLAKQTNNKVQSTRIQKHTHTHTPLLEGHIPLDY